MKVRNVVGYMLGNDYHVYTRGDQWADCDVSVYICRDIDAARRIMNASRHPLYDGIRWSTIYRVHAPVLECSCVSGDMLWTNQATKIIVDRPVAYHNAKPELTEENLRSRATQIMPQMMRLINGKTKERVK